MYRTVFARVVSGIAVLALTLSATLFAGQDKPAETGKLAVSVEYTGKGTVDNDHHLWIWVFDNPDSSTWADSQPLAVASVTENGASHKFASLPKQVYLAAGYDEKGGYDGTAGAPPSGTPVSVYGATAGDSAAAVTTGGDDAALKFTFDDGFRMP
jgi:uncharacterized protein (DUF2141 family)